MSEASDYVELEFGDGTYRFRLRAGQWRELQRLTSVGPFELYNRLAMGFPMFDDVRETIRLALVGGAVGYRGSSDTPVDQRERVLVDPPTALRLVETYVDPFGKAPLHRSRVLAQAIVGAALVGMPDEELGSKKGEGETAEDPNPSTTAESDGLQSSPPSPTAE